MEMLRDGLHHSLEENAQRLARLKQAEFEKAEMNLVEEEACQRIVEAEYEGNRHERRARAARFRKAEARIKAQLKELAGANRP